MVGFEKTEEQKSGSDEEVLNFYSKFSRSMARFRNRADPSQDKKRKHHQLAIPLEVQVQVSMKGRAGGPRRVSMDSTLGSKGNQTPVEATRRSIP